MTEPRAYDLHYGGRWQKPVSTERIEVRSPATGALLATVPAAGPADVTAAADAAQEAFDAGWGRMDALDRARPLRALAELLRARMGQLAELESAVTGRPIREMRAQMARIPEWIEYFASIAVGLEAESNLVKGGFVTLTAYEPQGVCALLTPWNHPVLILVKKLAAALAAGNCCLIKPSELAPVSPLILAEWAMEAGLPPGVVNVVTGAGPTGALVCDAAPVRRIDLTGGTATGRKVAARAGERLVPCTLELGGKTPVVIFADAPLDEAVAGAAFAAFVAAGQTCVSASRFLVARPLYNAFCTRLGARADALRLGDPADPATDMGPVISAAARTRCLDFIARAKAEGARLVAGGAPPDLAPPFDAGHYLRPTVFADVTPESHLFQEEAFGPVVSVTPFETEAEAVELANDSAFALGAAVWTCDVARAHRLSRAIRAGVLWINDHHKNDPRSIWGGFDASGWGKENGWDALRSYLRKRSIVIRTASQYDDWFAGKGRYG
ncbi:aldehyde dehydrogenase family protein [Zavarzinia sp.]|uniref:aldehyde dehydrogenase family protein n=1 Tax=Zavarzinia sp. TaxID=2027920 RepID=UPI003562DB87